MPQLPKHSRTVDLCFILALLAIAAALVLPTRGGVLLYYMDNPIHIAELDASIREAYRGWSDTAYMGYFLGGMHSPIWYGAMRILALAGLPLELVYGSFLLLGLIGPALAIYLVARRRGVPLAGATVGLLLTLLPAIVVGAGSVFGGMWTFNLSMGVLILIMDRLSIERRDIPHLSTIAALTGVALLTHLYAVIPIALLVAGRAVADLARHGIRRSAGEIVAVFVGWLAACAYWGYFVAAGSLASFEPQHLSPASALLRLVTPIRILDLLTRRSTLSDDWWQGWPLWLLIALSLAGMVASTRRARDDRDPLPRHGALVLVGVVVLVVGVAGWFNVRFLGPFSWRLLSFAYIGMAVMALPALAPLDRMRGRHITAAVFGIVALIHAAALGMSMRGVAPLTASQAIQPAERLWGWLRDNRNDEWGRVYLQDTFQIGLDDIGLSKTHILALTFRESGVRQLGASYGLPMSLTGQWTPSEFGTLFRRAVRTRDDVKQIKQNLWMTNSTHLVTSNAATTATIRRLAGFTERFTAPPFVVFATGVRPQWSAPLEPQQTVRVTTFETGRLQMTIDPHGERTDVRVKVSYHPFWQMESDMGGSIDQTRNGLLVVKGVGPERGNVRLEFKPPAWPVAASALPWVAIIVLAALSRKRRPTN